MNKNEKLITERFEKVCRELGQYKKTLKEFYTFHKHEKLKYEREIASLQVKCQDLETDLCGRD